MKNTLLILALFACALILNNQAWAQTFSHGDSQFMHKAVIEDLGTIQACRLALHRTKNTSVKRYANGALRSRSTDLAYLRQLASKNNLSMPTSMSRSDRQNLDRLSRVSNSSFDLSFMRLMANHDGNYSHLFKQQSAQGTNPELVSYCSSSLSKIQNHMSDTQDLMNHMQYGAGGNHMGGMNPPSNNSSSSSGNDHWTMMGNH